MFAVQIGHHAWLGTSNYLDDVYVTTSIRHAHRYETEVQAIFDKQLFEKNRAKSLFHLNHKQRDFYTTAPVTVITAETLDARLQTLTRPGDRGEPAADAASKSVTATEPKVRPLGVTRQIFQWTLDHPSATKADVQAAFPSANPSTVSVQFSAARRSQVS